MTADTARNDIVIAGAVRTPIGKFGGTLVPLKASDLGVAAAKEAMRRAGVAAEHVEETFFGHGRQAGGKTNTARQVSVRSGIPVESTATTVNMACASSLKAIAFASDSIRLGRNRCVLAGGTESMSNTPFFLLEARFGYRLGHGEVVDGMYHDGFQCPLADQLMGRTAETLAERYGITRLEQDAYAVRTQQRCAEATARGVWKEESFGIEVPGRKGPTILFEDEHPRADATVESMGKLPPVFKKDGTVHAGNSSGITDGAAAMLVMSAARAAELGVTPMARVVDWAQAGVDPKIMGIGPVPAIRKLFERTGLTMADIDLFEMNEAFAAQVLACDRDLGIDPAKMNVNGGAIALGHPIGATGSRIVVTLLHEMRRRGAKRGIASLCVSGGMGMAVLFENVG
ncbi:MAG: thiolase family protein [Planctomycetes bacterium]|nr:thiolase family protein [Planctomycetota bacterium]